MSTVFTTLYHQLYLSYLEARKNKRNTHNQLKFELDFESNLYQLTTEILNGSYTPKPCIAFMVYKPVQREIFAADFADRVVHHLLYRCLFSKYINPFLIADSYSCRKGKGTLYGARRVDYFIRSCTKNYTKQAYILKLDVAGYFMNIKHAVLYNKVLQFLNPTDFYFGLEFSTIDFLLQKTIFTNVAAHCIVKGNKEDWNGLPKEKSLFDKPSGIGLPIGNLTSQIFGNVYLNDLDHYIKTDLKFNYYGRYVDDMVFIHQEKEVLNNAIPIVEKQLNNICLRLHPKKIYLQECRKGVLFLGHYIKPYRRYISKRTKANFYAAINKINFMLQASFKVPWQTMKNIRALLNSYLGTLQHVNSYYLIKSVVQKLSSKFYYFFGFTKNYSKAYIKIAYWQWHYSQTFRCIN